MKMNVLSENDELAKLVDGAYKVSFDLLVLKDIVLKVKKGNCGMLPDFEGFFL